MIKHVSRATNKRTVNLFMEKTGKNRNNWLERFGFITGRWPKYRSCERCKFFRCQWEVVGGYYALGYYETGCDRDIYTFIQLDSENKTWKTGCRGWRKGTRP